MNMKAVFFDLDGVLVDSEVIHQKMWRDYSDRIHAEIPPEHFYCLVGSHRSQNLWSQILKDTKMSGKEEEFLSGFLEFYKKTFRNVRLWEHVFPDVRDFLQFLKKKGVYIACASSSNISYIQDILRGADLMDYFDLLVSSDDFEHSKPAPDIYLYCLAHRRENA
jgi:beta-phosphoglucomutase-like phosphatase (HAD superfamily)